MDVPFVRPGMPWPSPEPAGQLSLAQPDAELGSETWRFLITYWK